MLISECTLGPHCEKPIALLSYLCAGVYPANGGRFKKHLPKANHPTTAVLLHKGTFVSHKNHSPQPAT